MTSKEVLGITSSWSANIDVSQLGLVTEYTTDEVRFFFDYMSKFPEFQPIYADTTCFRNGYPWTNDSDYVVFMFHEGELIRVSMRFQGHDAPGCQRHAALFQTLAQKFGMPLLGTPGAWRLAWDVAGRHRNDHEPGSNSRCRPALRHTPRRSAHQFLELPRHAVIRFRGVNTTNLRALPETVTRPSEEASCQSRFSVRFRRSSNRA